MTEVLQGPYFLTRPLDLDVHRPAVLMSNQIGAPIQSRLNEFVDQPSPAAELLDDARLYLRLRFC